MFSSYAYMYWTDCDTKSWLCSWHEK